jgi:RimJ/RimL family protein N-acetyltransferase
MDLIWPSLDRLPGYVDALERGWSPDNLRGAARAQEQLTHIAEDPAAFVASLVDREAATQALREVLQDARAEGLRYVDLTARPDNTPSRRVIEANGGVRLEEFTTPAALGGHREVRYRVHLD